MEQKTINENKHKELLSLLNPLVGFMDANDYSYFIVAGKDGTCARHLRGDREDVSGMIAGMCKEHLQVREMMEDIVNALKGSDKK